MGNFGKILAVRENTTETQALADKFEQHLLDAYQVFYEKINETERKILEGIGVSEQGSDSEDVD